MPCSGGRREPDTVQQQQPSALAALHEAEHGDGMTFRQPGSSRRRHTISAGHAQNSTFPLQRRTMNFLQRLPTQSWLAPHVAGLLTGLVCCNDASPYVRAAAAGLNREDKCGILNIRAIVSLPLCCQ
ncbi:hypothetical protein NQZ68_036209, partial [Dissostichus eleginoides]